MNPNMAYYAVNTKIVTKKGRILDNKDWNKFIESTSIEQLADLLKSNLEFRKAFEDVDISENVRVNLETVLSRFRKIEIENLLHYFSGNYKEFLITFLMEEEINDLSLILRKLSRGESLEGIKDRFVHSDLFATLDFDDLMTVKSIEELTKKLKGTIYYNGLRNLTNEDALKRDFHIEMKLYVVLYKTIFEAAERLDKEDFNAVKEIMGLKIDLLNTQWIFRALKYYNIKPEEIFIYSLEGGRKIGYDKLRNLCYSKSLDEFKKLVKSYLEYDIFKDLNNAEIDINVVIDSYMFNYLKNKNYHNIGIAISFIYLLDIIINDLTSLTEGIQYNVPKDKLKGYLSYKL
ncbi:MAG: V-type ATPase subunit [Sedimentibacter sp.]